jgi:PAS domain S-box-containing protein
MAAEYSEKGSAVLAQRPETDNDSGFNELLFEWIDYPLLIAEDGLVVASNDRACELCGRPRGSLAGLSLASAVDLLYRGAESVSGDAGVEVHQLSVEGRSCQLAVMRVPPDLGKEESSYRAVLDKSFDAWWIATADGKILDFNEKYAALTGYEAADLKTMSIGEVDRDNAGWQIGSRLGTVNRFGFDEFRIRQQVAGTLNFIDLEVRLSVLPKTGGRVLGCMRDGTAAGRIQTELERSRRGLRTIEESLRLAQTAGERQALFDGICECLVKTAGYATAWVVTRDPDGKSAVKVEASAGLHPEYPAEVQMEVDHPSLAFDESDQPVAVHMDFESGELAGWKEKAVQFGFVSSLSLPVRCDGRQEAALNIYASQPGAFDEESMRVLAQVAGSLELGLEVQRKRSIQKAMEKNARDWDENFRAAFETSLNGIIVYDLDGKILDANAEFCNRLGYTRQELVGSYLDQIETLQFAEKLTERLASIRDDGFAVFETEYVARDETVHPASISCRTYTYGEGQIVMGICRDIVQPASASERWLHLALAASETGLFDWDLRTNKVAYSSEWKAQLGYKDEEISDDFGEWELRVHPDDVERLIDGLKAYVKRPDSGYESEFRIRHKNGSYRWMLARGAILYNEEGKAERMLGSHVDITDRKRLQQQQHQLQKLDSVGRVATGIAQDFDHLLTIINGYSDLVLSDLYEGDPLKQKIEAIRDAGGRAMALTHRLLGFSQRPPIAPSTVNLNTIVADGEDMMRRLMGPEVELKVDLSPEIPYVSADPRQMTLLIANLVMNARDAMPSGGRLAIDVKTVDQLPPNIPEPSPGPFVRLTVEDTGSGMDEETRLQVFDPFFTTKQDGSRTGLGLSTVFGIVRRHGGTIAVASDPGKGTAFHVYLPTAMPAERERAAHSAEQAVCGTVLVMDEDAALRRLMADVLAQAGYRTLAAANEGEAMLAAERNGALDLMVTASSEAIERVRKLHPDMKAVITGGPLLPKPFTTLALVETVRRHLIDEPEGARRSDQAQKS